MQDNQGNEIRLVIAGLEAKGWDQVEIDSQIDTPAENWSFTLFETGGQALNPAIKGGAKVQAYYSNQLILTAVADRISEAV
ncbi:TPA: hypothetical protein QIT83_004012, partial [Acinetobacter baumannii]|nr:hypothetical protein [Acinetobacter baumannii]